MKIKTWGFTTYSESTWSINVVSYNDDRYISWAVKSALADDWLSVILLNFLRKSAGFRSLTSEKRIKRESRHF